MPYTARKRGKRWAIVNTATGKVAGYSNSRKKAKVSASIRNRAHAGKL